MKRKYQNNLFLLVLLCALFNVLGIRKMDSASRMMRLTEKTAVQAEFRDMEVGGAMLDYLEGKENRGTAVGIYLLESRFGYQKFAYPYSEETFQLLKKKWERRDAWREYVKINQALWDDVKYFPIPVSTTDRSVKTAFENSWLDERTYGGKRGHEGTDIMASKNIRGVYPIVSMTDGVVEQMGWLEKGGWRIGIRAPSGGYFYYAHLDSYAKRKEGDRVYAGEILGFMGDSGYGQEGTKGKFPVHLHVGIYVYPDKKEMSVNPYWILRYLKKHELKCAYSAK